MTEPTNPTRLGRRVVVTGIGGITALGHDWPSIANRLKAQKNCVVTMADWDKYDGLNTRLAAPVTDFEVPSHYSRKKIRS
ncbi:MAG: beta-ketoacyl synthase N-terminal-like domain-containing protein, partial [Shewanella sp.]